MILTGALIVLLVATYGAAVIHAMAVTGLSRGQALLYAPLKLLYRIDDKPIRDARSAKAPVIYVVTHQSRLDPALMLALLVVGHHSHLFKVKIPLVEEEHLFAQRHGTLRRVHRRR